MDEDQLFLRPTKPPPGGISEDLYQIVDAYNFTKAQLAKTAGVASRNARDDWWGGRGRVAD
jgi:hypothetical protein